MTDPSTAPRDAAPDPPLPGPPNPDVTATTPSSGSASSVQMRLPFARAGGAPGAAHPHDSQGLQAAIRELVLLVVVLVGASRFLEGPLVWLVLAIVAGAVAIGSLQLMGDSHPVGDSIGIPVESLILPTVAAVAGIGIIRLAPIGVGLVPILLVLAYAIQRAVTTEVRILLAPHGATPSERTFVLLQILVLGFAAFAGIAALVPGGLPDLGSLGPDQVAAPALSDLSLATIVVGDALIAGLLGYRAAALRIAAVRDVAISALTYAAVIGIAAGGIRAMEIPRLLGPGLLTLVLYLWDTIHGAPTSRRRDAQRVWEVVLLAGLGVLVVVWILAGRTAGV